MSSRVRVLLAVVAVAAGVLVALVAFARPVVLVVVLAGLAVGGAIGGWASRRRRLGGVRGVQYSLPPGTPMPMPAARRSRPLLPIAIALLAILAAAFSFFASLPSLPYSPDDPDDGPPSRRPDAVAVGYAGRFAWDGGGWRGTERLEVPRRLLGRYGRHPRGALGRGWQHAGGGRTLTFRRDRTLPVRLASFPRFLTVERLEPPSVPLLGGPQLLVPREGSAIAFTGPRRLVYGTDPGARERSAFGGEETVTIALPDMSFEQDAVRLELANRLGRTGLYEHVRDVGFWGPFLWLAGLVSTGVGGFFVDRWLKRRWG